MSDKYLAYLNMMTNLFTHLSPHPVDLESH